MVITVRDLADDAEWERQYELVATAFGAVVTAPEEPMRSVRRSTVDERLSIVVLDDDVHIGGCAASLFDLAVPGGASVTATGLSGVGVRSDSGGRGAMRAMVTEHLERSSKLGAAASLLMATEPSLYGRFGYGLASSVATHRVNIDRAELAEPFVDAGRVVVLDRDDSQRDLIAAVYERLRSSNVGLTSRNDGWWQVVLSDDDDWKGPAKPFVAVHYDEDGEPDGYALYVIDTPDGQLWRSRATVDVHEFVVANVDAEKALWQFLTTIPLTRDLRWRMAPVEPRIRLLMTHRRELDTEMVNDMLWLRPLDVAMLLETRTYERDGSATFAVADEVFPDQAGPWRVSVEGGRATVERCESAELTLTPEQFGMAVLGGTSLRTLLAAGLVNGSLAEVGTLSDLLATTDPLCTVSRF